MVKKSLFARLFSRPDSNGSGAAVAGAPRVAAQARGPARAAPAKPVAVKPAPAKPAAAQPEAIRRNGTPAPNGVAVKPAVREPAVTIEEVPRSPRADAGPAVKTAEMSRQEELSVRLKEGFQGISTVLSGLDQKIDRQQRTSEELMVSVRRIPEMMKDVPDASKAGLELLATISTILESQGRATHELLARMGDLPQAMTGLEERLNEQVTALSRTGAEAQVTARETQRQVAASLSQVTSRVDALATAQSSRQDEMLREIRRQQEEHDRRVDSLLLRSRNSARTMIFLLIVVIAALLLVVQQASHA